MDKQQRGRIRDDLIGFFKGDLLFRDLERSAYSTDASIFQVQPAGVVRPRDEEDVQALVRYAHENAIPLIARGAGTGVAGESLGTGIIVDLSKYLREILEVGTDFVRVQPGVTLAALNQKLAAVGRRFAPDPASGQVCTLGGMLANDASGAHALKHGYTHDHVEQLRIVLDNGDAVTVGKERVPQPGDDASSHLHDILMTLAVLVEQHEALIRSHTSPFAYNRCGYRLDSLLHQGSLDLPRLLVGSEGTLALFTEATLRTIPVPGGRSLVLLGFSSVENALRAVTRTLPTGPSACELLDRRLLSLARGSDAGRIAGLVTSAAEAVLLVEYETDSPDEAERQARALADALYRKEHRALQASVAVDPREYDELWQLREVALPSLYAFKGGSQPVPFVEDVGVPVEALHEYLRQVQGILKEHETTASFLIHAGTGQVHTRPFLDLQKPEQAARLWDLAEKIHTLALSLGGTVSSQHGTGLARTPWVARQAGPLYPLYRQVKAIFDPKNLFNPGKIVDPDPRFATWPLRTGASLTAVPSGLALRWGPGELAVETNHCNGCGHCRTETAPQRMCPIFRATHAEEASPRGKVNVIRQLLLPGADVRDLACEELRPIAEQCVNCRMCVQECPARINVCKLMLEAKAANVAEHGLDRTQWFLARLENVVRWGSSLSFLTNLALGSRGARWLLDRLFGIAPQRRLPRFSMRPFLARAKRRGWTHLPRNRTRPLVVYFVDLYANYIDPQIAEATVAVLQHNGFDVYVPLDQRSSGLEAFNQGDVETARDIAQHNLRVLADLARDGIPIVCSEPSAALMLRQDYYDLIDDSDAVTVAGQTVESSAFLWDLHLRGRLRTDFQPLDFSVGHHIPCHVKALGKAAGPALLGLVPRLRVQAIDVSCSGMAGTFGLETRHYDTARRAGLAMLEELGRPRSLFGATECSSCRMQMEDGAGKRTLHPVQYLALAYGLMPEVARRLQEPIRELVLR